MFLLLLAFSWTLVGCFVAFQYQRERQFKAELLDSRLQALNARLLDSLPTALPAGCRLTVMDTTGRVLRDNAAPPAELGNHRGRPEVAGALASGTGFAIDRLSTADGTEYFYSAMRRGPLVVRTALPYNHSLHHTLRADGTFLWFMVAMTLLVSLTGYMATRRLGRTVARLNDFASRAERGERVYDEPPFPPGELGSISDHIIRLYARLQQALEEGERDHRRAMAQEHEKTVMKKQLTNNINHELKTPVAAMQACLDTLVDHPDLPRERRDQFLQKCHAQCSRLAALLSDVSVITRLDDGARQVEMGTVELRGVAEEAVADVDIPQGFTVENALPRGLAVRGNAGLLTSVFRNLVANAVAHSGGTRMVMELTGHDAGRAKIAVWDDGRGVPSQHLPRLFERFYRVDAGRTRADGGTGLGLAIVKNAVALHGGAISVSNGIPHGLRFVFTLPLA